MKKWKIAAAAVCVCLLFTAAYAAGAGSANDPLVTLSYLNTTFSKQVQGMVDQTVDQRRAEMEDALAKVLTAMASPEVGVDLANKSGCAPANNKSYDDPQVAAKEMITIIQKTASTAQPMPNIPEMGSMWGPVETMLTAINKNGADPAQAAVDAQAAAEQAIADMQ